MPNQTAMQPKIIHRLNDHSKAAVSLKYSEDGSKFATVSADKKCIIYDTNTGKLLTVLDGEHKQGLNDLAWMDTHIIATASDDGTIKLWDIEKSHMVLSFRELPNFVCSLSMNPLNRVLISGTHDGYIQAFHFSSRDALINTMAHSEPIISIDFDQWDSEFLSAAQDGIIRFWDFRNYLSCSSSIYPSPPEKIIPISCASFSPNAKYILKSSLNSEHQLIPSIASPEKDNNFGFNVDLPGKPLTLLPLQTYKGHINKRYYIKSSFFINSKRKYVISGSEDNKVMIWDLNTGSLTNSLNEHKAPVVGLDIRPCHNVIEFISGSLDGEVIVWRDQQSDILENIENSKIENQSS